MSISCSICTEILTGRLNKTVSTTNCGHVFHQSCIFQWIKRSETCPICRKVQTINSIIDLDLSIVTYIVDGEAQLKEMCRIAIEECEENKQLELKYRRLNDMNRSFEDEYRRLCVENRRLLDENRRLLDENQRLRKEIFRLKIELEFARNE